MRQWKSLVPALHLHVPAAAASSCFPHPPSPSPCPSPPREEEQQEQEEAKKPQQQDGKAEVVRLVGCDGRVRAYPAPVTARELMQQHPRHLVCRANALLIGEKIPAVAPGEELQPGQAYFLLAAHLFRSVLSFVSLASSLLLLLSTAGAGGKAAAAGIGGGKQQGRPFELHRTGRGRCRSSSPTTSSSAAEAGRTRPSRNRPACCVGTHASPRTTRSSSGIA
jgi:hypothetical protein